MFSRWFGGRRDAVPDEFLPKFDELELDFAREVLGPYLECSKLGEKQMRGDVPLGIAKDIARHISTTIAELPARCIEFRTALADLSPGEATAALYHHAIVVMDAWHQEISAYLDAATHIAAFGFTESDIVDGLAARIEETTGQRTELLRQLVELRGHWPR